MKKIILFFIFILFMGLTYYCTAEELLDISDNDNSLHTQTSVPKLYRPNFVTLGEKAEFKVVTTPIASVKLVMDYGYETGKKIFKQKANIYGICTFNVDIPVNNNLAGKDVLVEAFIIDDDTNKVMQKVVAVDINGKESMYSRIYIASNKSAKGFYLSPSSMLNDYLINNDFDDNSGFDPMKDQIYGSDTPVNVRNMRDQFYDKSKPVNVRNMRDAKDNVR